MLGEVIHGYRVDRALSVDKGGMGDVFFATHVESGADAVVKVLKPEMSARRDIVTRFFNEARAAASIHHPGIVQIHNVGYHNERAYLLMERLRGDDLENRLRAGPVPLDRAIVFMRQAAGAIAAAHDRGIVHRDLKPANLFVVPDPDVVGGERVRVLDFGIAKLSMDTGGNKTQGIFGTPAYMSPEQCASSGDVDPRSDLYALGCIFYELVTGRPPFGHGGIELVAAHLRDMPASPRTVAAWVPPSVDQIIMHLLAKHPDQRPPSCAALIAALDHIHATLPPAVPHGPVSAGMSVPMPAARAPGPSMPPSYPPNAPTAPTVPRNRNTLWIGLALAAAAAMIVAAVVVTSGGSSKQPSVAAGEVPADAAPPPPPPAVDAAIASTPPPPPPPPPSGDPKAQASELNEAGKIAMFDSRFDDAVTAFTRAAALDPSPLIFFNLGVAHYQAGHCGEARIALQAALADDAADAKLREKTKKLLKTVGDCSPKQVAVADPKPKPQPTPLDPKPAPKPDPMPPPPPDPRSDPKPDPAPGDDVARVRRAVDLNNEGREAFKMGMFAKSAKLFREAIALDPEPKYYFNLGASQISLGQCGEAVKNFDRIINGKADQSMKDKAAKMKERCP